MSVRPLDDRVLIKPSKAEEKTAGGIILPDAAKEKPQQGEVIAIGPGKMLKNGERAAMSVKIGDVVLYGKYSGNDIKIDNEEHKILRETDLLARFE